MEILEKNKNEKRKLERLPNLSKKVIFFITFGYFGINMAFFLQTSQMSRIFQTIGANPTKLGYFFILPPLAGMIVQPLVGKYSDKTWNRFGRRMPYLLIGSLLAFIVLILLPNSGSLGLGYASAMALLFGAVVIMVMDVSANMSMQPFRMIIGDMVNDDQQDKAWSWQNIFSNLGGMLASILPFFLTFCGISNIASKGIVPMSVKISFYIAAVVILITSFFTIWKVKEFPPKQYERYHYVDMSKKPEKLTKLLKEAPPIFWEMFLVLLFAFFAVQYVWTYSTGALSSNVWNTVNPNSIGFQDAGNWYGVLTFIQAIASVLWGVLVLTRIKPTQRKRVLSLSLFLGAIGLISLFFIHNQWLTIIPFVLFGIAYISIGTEAFAIFTVAIQGKNEGAYMGLFNWEICVPQIIASLLSFSLFKFVHQSMPTMILIAGISLGISAVAVIFVHPIVNIKKKGTK